MQKLALPVVIALVLVSLGVWLFLREGGGPIDDGPGARDAAELAGEAPPESLDPVVAKRRLAGATGAEAEGQVEVAVEPDVAVADLRPVVVTGRVTGRDGVPVVDARVVALDHVAWLADIEREESRFQKGPQEAIAAVDEAFAQRASISESARTDADGRYALHGLTASEYRLLVRHEAHLPEDDLTFVISEARLAGDPIDPLVLDVELFDGFGIEGLVVDAEGAPIADVEVSAVPSDRARARGLGKIIQTFVERVDGKVLVRAEAVKTDAAGHFRVQGLEPVAYELRAVKDGYFETKATEVPAGVKGVTIRLPEAPAVSGTLVDPRGAPVPDARVVLREPHRDLRRANPMSMASADLDLFGERTRRTESNAEGRFELRVVRVGDYQLVVESEGFAPLTSEVRAGDAPVDLGELKLSAGVLLRGLVLDEAGRGVKGARVWVPVSEEEGAYRPLDARAELAATESDARGSFELGPLPLGDYEVRARAEGTIEAMARVSAESAELELVLSSAPIVSGRVVRESDRSPVAGAKVFDSGRNGSGSVESDADGFFELPLSGKRGKGDQVGVRVEAAGFEPKWHFQSVDAETPLEIPLTESRYVFGTVVDAEGQPVVGARVSFQVPGLPDIFLTMGRGAGKIQTRTNDAGEFLLDLPRGGEFGAGLEMVATSIGKGRARFAIPDGPGKESLEVELQLAPGIRLGGQVRDAGGALVRGAKVQIARKAQLPPQMGMMLSLLPPPEGEVGFTGSDGLYSIEDLEPGTYSLRASASGYATVHKNDLVILSDTQHDVQLAEGLSISGRIVDESGRPFLGAEAVVFLESRAPRPPSELQRRMPEEFVLEMERVQRASAPGLASTNSGADGEFVLRQLSEGTYRVIARAAGYHSAEIAPVEAGSSSLELTLVQKSSIEGVVYDEETRAPVTKFTLRPQPKTDGRYRSDRMWSGQGDFESPEGRFRVDELHAGPHLVQVEAEDYAGRFVKVDLVPGENELQVALGPGARVSGVVVRADDGAPIQGVHLQPILRLDSERHNSGKGGTRTESDGTFTLRGISDGEHSLSVSHPEYHVVGSQARFMVPDDVGKPLRVEMQPAARLRGQIRGLRKIDRRREYLQIAIRQRVEPGEISPTLHGFVRDDGEYSVDSIPPGDYEVLLTVQTFGGPQSPGGGEQAEHLLGETSLEAAKVSRFDADAPPELNGPRDS